MSSVSMETKCKFQLLISAPPDGANDRVQGVCFSGHCCVDQCQKHLA
jgi:hypothetical protein